MTTLELFTMAILMLAFAVFATLLIKARVDHLSLMAEVKKDVAAFEARIKELESSNTVTTVVTTKKLEIAAPVVAIPEVVAAPAVAAPAVTDTTTPPAA